ncbi:MAG: DUF308 domain-containing protein [Candidatus Saccharibacteria bacterium]|nr:DUF308 domain-containing protein [Candidatus Saccharibacteria bacterium]
MKRKYVDSHWLIFAVQGVFMLLFGWFTMFANVESLNTLVAVIGTVLLGLGVIELFNLLRRTVLKETWGLSLALAVFEIAVAFTLLFTLDMNSVLHLAIIASYVVVRGLLEILIGLRSVDDRTDKFIWTGLGVIGCIMGFVILNSETFAESIGFIKVFGSYMMLAGFTHLIYGVHNNDQAKILKEQRTASAKRSASKRSAVRKPAAKAPTKKAPAKKLVAKKAPAKKKSTSRKK